jgi:hypothetical protein
LSRASLAVVRVTAVVGLAAIAVWLGGLIALGALAAPVVFSVVPLPTSADAMTLVFRRFDQVAMACGALVLASEAARAVARISFVGADWARVAASVTASALAIWQGEYVSPRIALLHMGGAIRGVGDPGAELSRLHDLAEALGKSEVLLLVVVVVTQVLALTRAGDPRPHAPLA